MFLYEEFIEHVWRETIQWPAAEKDSLDLSKTPSAQRMTKNVAFGLLTKHLTKLCSDSWTYLGLFGLLLGIY